MNIDKRILHEVKKVRLFILLAVGLGSLAGALAVFQAWLLSGVVNRVFLEHGGIHEVKGTLAAMLAAILGRAAAIWAGEAAAFRAASLIKHDLRRRLFRHLLALGPVHATGERTGELVNTLVEGIEALEAYIARYIPQLALAAIIPLGIIAFILPLDPLSGIILLITVPLFPFFMNLIGKMAQALTRKQWETLSRMSAHFLDVLQGLTTLKILGRSREQVEVIARIGDQFRRTTMGVLRVAFLSALVLELLATVGTAMVAVEVGLRLLYGHLPFREAFFVLLLTPEFYLPLRTLGAHFHAGMGGVDAARRIFEVLETPPPPPLAVVRRLPEVGQVHIRFDGVHYAYDNGKRPALRGISFEVRPGERVAMVGPSGGGKSTVMRMLLGFIRPDRGEIHVNGVPLSELRAEEWRRLVSWVPQNPYIFYGTVAENIRLGRPDAPMEEVIHAAHLAGAHDFITALTQGYETQVGERGVRLSGGEAQRIAIARAFLKDAPLLLLDEATAHLDPEIERLIREALERLMKGRTVLMIAHRLSTARCADRILVVDGGRVVEQGSHEELFMRGGLYRRLLEAYGGF